MIVDYRIFTLQIHPSPSPTPSPSKAVLELFESFYVPFYDTIKDCSQNHMFPSNIFIATGKLADNLTYLEQMNTSLNKNG